MKKVLSALLFVLFVFSGCAVSEPKKEAENSDSLASWNYPQAKRAAAVDEYFGVKVEDNYRWLEENDNPEVKSWTEAQNSLTEKTIFGWEQSSKIEKRLTELWDFDKMNTPVKKGGKIFYSFQKGLQNQPVLLVQLEDGTKKELVDPNTINAEGTTAMDWWFVSPTGKYISYGLSENGSEQSFLHILNVETMEKVDAPIDGCRYASVGWMPDESGFFYSRKLDGNKPGEIDTEQSVRFHKLGTSSENDEIIAKSTLKEGIIVSAIDNEGKWLLISEYMGSSGKAKLDVYNIASKTVKPVFNNFDNIYEGEIYNGNIYLKTDKDNALNWKIIKVNCETLAVETVIPENEKDVIEFFTVSNGSLLIAKMHDVASRVLIVDLSGKNETEIKLPVLGNVQGLSADSEKTEIFISFSSFAYPPAIFEFTKEKGLQTFWKADVAVDVKDIITEQVFYKSKDGTDVPMFIIYKKGLEKNGRNHTFLRGYGGFNVTYPMYFSTVNAVWLETGGIMAIANIRGGGEYGERWHRSGMLDKKQNSFDDFAYAMKYLTDNRYTNPEKLAIWGGSNGGLLTGAMVTQYSDLFKAAVVAVPLLDMLRFHKFLIGRYWVSEYGSSDDKAQFEYILKYSPYQNIKKDGRFPAVLLTAGEQDSRVHPMHAKKMAAALQYENKSDNPIFLWVETKAGHGQGKSSTARIKESAMELGFFLKMLSVEGW
ncbi:MAG TPA: prolyl oligopeptidase family serine peptidase [bacterium]|nr:prolyl oligopeptidase family serine peptidase [bacterium]HPS28643.1 prolyl oligopeptidase family serine peptidase [bacterium]